MTEARVAFLYKAASLLPTASSNKTQEKLKSYFRMRCKELSKGYGLPQKIFSEQVICTHCCLEWRNGTEVKVNSIKLSKRQRKRMKSQNKRSNSANKANLLDSNEIEKTCTFCKHISKTVVLKPNKPVKVEPKQSVIQLKSKTQKQKTTEKPQMNKISDVYSNAAQVFSLNNKKNTLKSTIKEPKIIKNNKKKKDKFAGLCQKAVLMSAQLKQQKGKQDKLSLFLKPFS